MNNNDKKISIFFLVFIAFFVACFFFASKNGLRGPVDKEEKTTITKSAFQTSEYYSDLENTKYIINSNEELKVFKSNFKGDLKLAKNVFDKNIVFVQVEEVPSSGIQKEFVDVLLEDDITFIIKTNSEGTLTDDMALWYYVAVIPFTELTNVNYSDWVYPSAVLKTNEEFDYVIETDNKYLTMQDDGGSNINIYYQIKGNKIIKIQDDYHANLSSKAETITTKLYEKEITDNDIVLIKDIYNREDLKHNSELPYSINDKEIYDQDAINTLSEILKTIDNN